MVLGRLLELGDYLTPSMLASLRKLAEDWRDDKLCTKRSVKSWHQTIVLSYVIQHRTDDHESAP